MTTKHTIAARAAAAGLIGASRNPIEGSVLHVSVLIAKLVIFVLFGGVIFRSLWNWYVTPVGPRAIDYAEAVGLVFVFLFVVRAWMPGRPTESRVRDEVARTAGQIAGMAIFWAMAAVWKVLVS